MNRRKSIQARMWWFSQTAARVHAKQLHRQLIARMRATIEGAQL